MNIQWNTTTPIENLFRQLREDKDVANKKRDNKQVANEQVQL